jgi:hypothetical protein
MKNIKTNTIIMSSLTVFALLTFVGCDSGSNSVDNLVTNSLITPDNPVVTTPDTVEEPIPEVIEPTLDSYKTAGWYGKTEVTATASDGKVYNHSTAGVFGELIQSDDAKDQHDIIGYGSAILQVVFPQTDWGDDNGDYFSDYKKYDEESNEKRVWTFQIKNQHTINLASAPISIKLDGTYDVTYKEENGKVEFKTSKTVNTAKQDTLNLVDVDNSTSYTLEELRAANLNMDGLHTRTFRWVAGVVDAGDYTPLVTAKVSAEISSKQIDTATFEETEEKIGKFGLPPQ